MTETQLDPYSPSTLAQVPIGSLLVLFGLRGNRVPSGDLSALYRRQAAKSGEYVKICEGIIYKLDSSVSDGFAFRSNTKVIYGGKISRRALPGRCPLSSDASRLLGRLLETPDLMRDVDLLMVPLGPGRRRASREINRKLNKSINELIFADLIYYDGDYIWPSKEGVTRALEDVLISL